MNRMTKQSCKNCILLARNQRQYKWSRGVNWPSSISCSKTLKLYLFFAFVNIPMCSMCANLSAGPGVSQTEICFMCIFGSTHTIMCKTLCQSSSHKGWEGVYAASIITCWPHRVWWIVVPMHCNEVFAAHSCPVVPASVPLGADCVPWLSLCNSCSCANYFSFLIHT